MSRVKPPALRKGDGSATVRAGDNQLDPKALVEWSEEEREELRFGSMVGLGYAGAVLAVYVRTMHPTVAGGDSGELMGAACELGVAHPPGYPLFTMLSWLGTKLIPVGSPGFHPAPFGPPCGYATIASQRVMTVATRRYRLNLVSVFFATTAAWLHFHTLVRWHLALSRPSTAVKTVEYRGSTWVGLLGSGLLSFSPLIWQYSIHAEVFAMNNMFLALLLFLVVRYVQERRVADANWGALVIGLGLTNQHTLLLYALPLVAWMLWLGRAQLLRPERFASLALLGLLGLTPYLYLFWAATHAPLGSWGDTSTLSGYPAVGFWTHFLRKEYGTFSLYSGKEGERNQLAAAFSLYASTSLRADSLFTAWAAVVGVGAGLRHEGARGVSAVLLTAFVFYMVVFHMLANLPLDRPLYLGVHMRFWMQPHLILFAFIALGLAALLRAAKLWNPAVAPALCLALVAAQMAVNFWRMDQSNNFYTYEFGRGILEGRAANAVLLTQGDLVTNSVRYLQRCEKRRPDVAHLDMPMMTYEWFKTRHVPHMPSRVVFPGMQFSVGARRLKEHRGTPFSMKQLLEANFDIRVGNATRPFYLIGGWYGEEGGTGDQMVAGWHAEPVGMGARITRAGKRLKGKEWRGEASQFVLPAMKALPDARKYDETTWERTILENYVSYAQVCVNRMDRAVAKGKEAEGSPWIKEQGELKKAIKGLEKLIALVRSFPYAFDLSDILRNTAIAYGRLKCPRPDKYPSEPCPGQDKMRELMAEFLRTTRKSAAETATERLVIENPGKFINLG